MHHATGEIFQYSSYGVAQVSKLNPMQEKFVHEYLVDLNASQAARRAGYSPKTADRQGGRLLKNVEIAKKISEAQKKQLKKIEVTAEWVIRRLAEEANADIADILTEDGAVRPVSEWPKVWRQGLVAGIDIYEDIQDGKKVGQTVKVKISERIKRLELLGKHLALFTERIEHTGNAQSNVLVIMPGNGRERGTVDGEASEPTPTTPDRIEAGEREIEGDSNGESA